MNHPTPNLNSPETNIYNQALPNESPTPAFAPLPIRARTTLEVLDTSVKLYRRYFKVLILWSMLVSAIYVASSVIPMVYVLALPLIYGAVSCSIAAAVRGENISFGQVWDFTKPRYGAVIGVSLLSFLILGIGLLVLFIVGGIIFGLGAYLISYLPEPVSVVAVIVGLIALTVVYSVVGAFAFGWSTMVPIVACLEDDKRGVASLGRAWSLMSGHWRRVLLITFLCGISIFIFFGIVGGFAYLIGSSIDAFNNIEDSAFWALMLGTTAVFAVFSVFWSPAQAITIAVLYLDLRVRKEALDIEWSDYTSKAVHPANNNSAPQIATPQMGVTQAVDNNPFEIIPSAHTTSPSSFGAVTNVAELQNSIPVQPTSEDVVQRNQELSPPPLSATNPFLPVDIDPEPVSAPSVQSSTFTNPTPTNLQTDQALSPVSDIPVSIEPNQPSPEQPEEISSFAPPAFSVGTDVISSPWNTENTAPIPSDIPPITDVPSFDIQPKEQKPEDSHEPRF